MYEADARTDSALTNQEYQLPGLEKIIEAVTDIATFEAEKLKSNQPFDMSTSNLRKARLLLDMQTAIRQENASQLTPDGVVKLKEMQVALRRSLRQIQSHSTAIKEVIAIVVEAAKDQQSDGTYSASKLA